MSAWLASAGLNMGRRVQWVPLKDTKLHKLGLQSMTGQPRKTASNPSRRQSLAQLSLSRAA